jgi:hypothetical protein
MFDLDLVAPHRSFVDRCGETIRGIAFQALDGEISVDTPKFGFGHPGGEARLVPVERFMRMAAPEAAALRDSGDHVERRAVLCEPVGRRFLGFGAGEAVRPLRFAQRQVPERFVVFYSERATTLMAERARQTIDVFDARRREFAEFEPGVLVKLGYPTPDGSREHLWFEVHERQGEVLDCTLVNRPFKVDLREGERAKRPLELLTDWVIVTPAGQITPRDDGASRRMRERAAELRVAMRDGTA